MQIPTRAGNVLPGDERVKDAPFAKFPYIQLDTDEWGWLGGVSQCQLP